MCETPIYDGLVAELGDPEEAAREFDTWVIMWHAERLRVQPPEGIPRGRHGPALCA